MSRSAVISTALVVGGLLTAAAPAFAQDEPAGPAPRWILGGTPFFQARADSFTDRLERATAGGTLVVDSAFDARSGFGLDGSVGVRLWRGFGAGASLSFYAPAEDRQAGGELRARIPHPFGSGPDRQVTLPAGLKRSETAVHVDLRYVVQAGPRLLVAVGAGPSFFRASQTFVNELVHSEETPAAPSTVRIEAVNRISASASGTGFNGTVDLVWTLTEGVGVGGLFRYSRATLTFAPSGRTVDAKAGGFQAGVGIRFMF